MTKQEAELILSNPNSIEAKVSEAKLTLENLGVVLESPEIEETEEVEVLTDEEGEEDV
jgi:hypothetical protein